MKTKIVRKKACYKLIMRRLSIISVAVFLLFSLLYGLYFGFASLFKIKQIELQGDTRYPVEEIIEKSGLEKGQNIFFCNSGKAKNKINSSFPYIEKIEIKRDLPGKLILNIQDAQMAMQVEYEDKFIVINEASRVLEIKTESVSGLLTITGMKPKQALVCSNIEYEDNENYLQMLITSIRENKLEDITQIDMSDLNNLCMRHQDRITVQLGTCEDIDCKLRTAANIISEKIQNSERGTLDLSFVAKVGRSYFSNK